jgi:hypothetical protein
MAPIPISKDPPEQTAVTRIPSGRIEQAILLVRGLRGMIDADLAITLWSGNQVGQKEYRKILERFFDSTNQRGIRKFEIPFWHLKKREKKYDGQFKIVFEAIRQLLVPPETKKRKIEHEKRTHSGQDNALQLVRRAWAD